jgi:hypothetical protein
MGKFTSPEVLSDNNKTLHANLAPALTSTQGLAIERLSWRARYGVDSPHVEVRANTWTS